MDKWLSKWMNTFSSFLQSAEQIFLNFSRVMKLKLVYGSKLNFSAYMCFLHIRFFQITRFFAEQLNITLQTAANWIYIKITFQGG